MIFVNGSLQLPLMDGAILLLFLIPLLVLCTWCTQDLEDMLVRLERQFKGEAAARERAEHLLSDALSKQAVLQQQLTSSRQQQEMEQAAIKEVGHVATSLSIDM